MRIDPKLIYAFIISLTLHTSVMLMPSEIDVEPEQAVKQQKKMTISLKKAYAAPMPAPVVKKQTPKRHVVAKKPTKAKKVKKVLKPETTPIIKKEIEKTVSEQAEPTANISSEPTVIEPVAVVNEPEVERVIQEQSKPKFDYAAYTCAVIDSVEANKSYPYLARRKGQTGLVVIVADVGKDGSITDIKIDQSSGYSLLDKDAIKLVMSVFPMKNESGETLTVTIPIRYMLN